MEYLKEIAIEISAVQSGLAAGDLTALTAQEELNKIRRKIMGIYGDLPGLEVTYGYRADAISQAIMFIRLVENMDMHTCPDSALNHLSVCAEMFVEKAQRYFKLRSDRALKRLEEDCHGE